MFWTQPAVFLALLVSANAADRAIRQEVILRAWEAASAAECDIHCKYTRTQVDKGFDTTEVLNGEIFRGKGNLLRIDGSRAGKRLETYLFLEGELRVYDWQARKRHGLPYPPKGSGGSWISEGARWIEIFGRFPVGEFRKECQVQLEKEDQYYLYVGIRPASKGWLSDFTQMRVVLARDGLWVREIWFVAFNGDEVKWDFEQPDTSLKKPITAESITPDVPGNWQKVDIGKPGHGLREVPNQNK